MAAVAAVADEELWQEPRPAAASRGTEYSAPAGHSSRWDPLKASMFSDDVRLDRLHSAFCIHSMSRTVAYRDGRDKRKGERGIINCG